MRREHRLLAGLLAAGVLLTATGCAQSVDPIERLGRKAAQRVHHPSPTPAAGPSAAHGDHGGAAPTAVISCRQLPESRHSRSSPPLRHWWPVPPGPYEGAGAGVGCERR
ncbi:hypothetical protein GCM10015535_29430 [Streptomyces gelaticus]|uniref:Excalibur calcium-binding domain-containing protein n=1 Tax=Streptomyces gelaticus TaxID=285446 RepID=A0ABQ2W0Y6_9ACTN|nr:hypothetical protein GCM10015535_29430 [Streptomyces gelaticus]